ncbi:MULTISPECIES: hypothetical protein [Rhodomicrobium]|uniref:hypothetical protein n=1 Tax=Rhodomicrobium TaxID=1068 RepID=UPI000F73A62A|nr:MULTISPECIES: hypothetical protein [Rhodomicrobium]
MRRFFRFLFVVSIIATAGALYWRTFLPEAGAPTASQPQLRGIEKSPDGTGPAERSFRSDAKPSERQDLAVTISILSSIISAVAALAQTWLTARAYRR